MFDVPSNTLSVQHSFADYQYNVIQISRAYASILSDLKLYAL